MFSHYTANIFFHRFSGEVGQLFLTRILEFKSIRIFAIVLFVTEILYFLFSFF